MVSLSRVFCCFNRTANENVKVDLIPQLEAKILEKTKKIIGDQTFNCPTGLKNHLIKKYTYEPGKIRKIISKMSKPAAKIIATFAVASILTPVVCTFILPSSIPVLPGLIVLGSEYWASVSVSLVSLAVYPLITATFGLIFNGISCASHFVARRVHLLGQRLGIFTPNNVLDRVSYHNLMSEIHYDPNTETFYHFRDTIRTDLRESYVRWFIQRALRLEKYDILLRGRQNEIENHFNNNENNPLHSNDLNEQSEVLNSLIGSFTSLSTLPSRNPSLNANILNTVSGLPAPRNKAEKKEHQKIRAQQAFNQMIANASQQVHWKSILNYYLKEKIKEEAQQKLEEMKNPRPVAQSSSPI